MKKRTKTKGLIQIHNRKTPNPDLSQVFLELKIIEISEFQTPTYLLKQFQSCQISEKIHFSEIRIQKFIFVPKKRGF